MMQFRRRWCAVALAAAAGILSSGTVFGADLAGLANDMAGATGEKAVTIRNQVISVAPPKGTVARDDYGKDVAKNFYPLVKNDKLPPEVQLNAAMTIAQMETLSCDSALENTIKNGSNPAVRFWGAKGLVAIRDTIQKVGGSTEANAIAALSNGLAAEKSDVAKEEFVTALAVYEQDGEIVKWLQGVSVQMQGALPGRDTLHMATVGLNQLTGLAGKVQNKVAAAQAAAWIASFASQQEVLLNAQLVKSGSELPEGYNADVLALAKSAVATLNALAGGGRTFAFTVSAEPTPEEIGLVLNGIAGSSGGPGKVQEVFPGVKVPPDVKK